MASEKIPFRKYEVHTKDIPRLVEQLKQLMGIYLVPEDRSHPLLRHFEEFERWNATLLPQLEPNHYVLEIADYALCVLEFRKDWSTHKIARHLSRKLRNPTLCLGQLFEFRAALHYTSQHKDVRWLPNTGNESEFDLQVTTHSDHVVMVECTRKDSRPDRLLKPRIVIADVLTSLRHKAKQANRANAPLLVAVFLPESIDWTTFPLREELSSRLERWFTCAQAQVVTAVSIVPFQSPRLKRIDDGTHLADTGLQVYTQGNRDASYPLPKDFYYGIDQPGGW